MVEWKKLGDVCEKTSNIKWKDQTDDKIYKYIDLSSISLNSHKVIVTTDICKQNAPSRAQQIVWANDILLGTTRPTLKRYCQIPSYLDKNICSTGFCIFRANKEYVLSRWLFHNIGSSRFWDYCELKQQGAGYPCLSNSDAFAYMIPIPSLSEQQRIVNILDTFTASIDNLKEQIAQRRKQYEYYRDQLLDLEGKEGVEMNSVAHFVKERILANELTAQNYTSVENLLKDKAGRKDAENVPSEGNWIKYQKGDVLIGNIRPYLRKIWLSDREGGTNGDVIVIRAKEALLPKFMFYCLASESFFLYYNQALKDGKMPRGEKNRVLSYNIPSIRKEEQQRIVSILDTFEASIQNLEVQLAQREKQYEYYRNKLLTFE